MSAAFLGGYLEMVGAASWMPSSTPDRRLLLDFYTIEKCIYEIGYELNNRPDWLSIPVLGLLRLIRDPEVRS